MQTNDQVIVAYLQKKFQPILIIRFGSCMTGKTHENSDQDIAFLLDAASLRPDDYTLFMAAQELADALGQEVDLVNLGKASTVFAMQIIVKGKIIYTADTHQKNLFFMKTYKEYSRLNEERAEILAIWGGQ